jgi:hypothetical protein
MCKTYLWIPLDEEGHLWLSDHLENALWNLFLKDMKQDKMIEYIISLHLPIFLPFP